MSASVCCDDRIRFYLLSRSSTLTTWTDSNATSTISQNSVLLSAAGLVGPAVISQTVRAAEPSVAPVARRRFVLSQTYKLNPPKGSSGVVKLWIPLPVDTAFQQMTALAFSGNYKQAYVTTNNTYGAKTLFATA